MNLKELKGKIIKRLKEFLSLINAHKVKSLFLLFLVIGIIWLILKYQTTACWMYGSSAEANGKLMTLIISIIGGGCVIYGLILNSRRVKEQTRQNDIAVQNNNDKRFGEAIGYMNSDNDGIVTGGIYALFQLAKEDKRYAPIVTNIFCNYVNEKKDDKHSQSIFYMLFSKNDNPFVFSKNEVFFGYELLAGTLYCPERITFFECNFNGVRFVAKNEIFFYSCNLSNVEIFDCSYINVEGGNMNNVKIIGEKNGCDTRIRLYPEIISGSKIIWDRIKYLEISPKKFIETFHIKANEITSLIIGKDFEIKNKLYIDVKKINDIKRKSDDKELDSCIIISQGNDEPRFDLYRKRI